MATRQTKLTELTPDHANANKGTERGRYALEASLRKYGAGRSILLDKDGRIIAGNKTAEVASEIGIDDVIIVQTDGKKLVAVQRTDLELDSKEGRELAYADNRVGELDLSFDPEQLLADVTAGVDLSGLWFPHELDALTGVSISEDADPHTVWQGMPEFEQDNLLAWKSVRVNFSCESDMIAFAALIGQTVTKNTQYVWFPKKEKEDLTKYKVLDES